MVIESIPKAVGMAYAIIATIIVVILMNRGKFSKRKGYILLVISTLFGFLIFAPMLPYQFQSIILGKTQQLGIPIALALVVLFAFVVLAFAFGRAFCGYVCPIGTIQELVYHLPVKKLGDPWQEEGNGHQPDPGPVMKKELYPFPECAPGIHPPEKQQ